MNIPTLEEYKAAKESYKSYCSWIRMARERKNELIDELAKERENELCYLEQAEKQHDIIRSYEIYEQIRKEGAE
jgi:hypothetical protein